MVTLFTVCPDCNEVIEPEVFIDYAGEPVYVCPECGVVHYDYSWYETIPSTMIELFEKESIKKKGLFVCDTQIEYIGIDNTGASTLIEEFPSLSQCLEWLLKEKEV